MASSTSLRQTLSTDLMACLGQEDMTDMHLLGTDGVKIPAFRTILACRSNVFRKMLLGNFEESASKVVKLGYNSEVLKAVVEFCITDNVLQFDGRVEETAAREIVQLIACAHFLNMPLLQDKARTLANTLLEAHKSLACAIFDEASLFGEPTESVKLGALAIVRKFPEDSLLSKPGICFLRPEALHELVSDDGIVCEEISLFLALNKWATAGNEDDSFGLEPEADRVSIAKYLVATHIRLSSIQPTDLIGIARKSCLVDEKMISEAFEAQALFAEKKMDVRFSKKRKGVDVVNGFYEKDGECESYPKYRKKCSWGGRGEERT
eukprot:CAMPEP_0201912302 /NCGR_PEP_ID=MMETSP0903-20130614/3007_1 /ASSEMBLY_ACC=CAM_ASM_000552 /TAXON_ID=420261 /ORGANISM="Thalassiosira antarctica, Strain CCMP982" /LENGTH=321 /DNA_ID=CAMNT_0048447237 /DNA_START=61 /DNA_END=1023 /DNA_ORIENTATION=-